MTFHAGLIDAWSRESCAQPPLRAGDRVSWVRTDGTVVGVSRDHTIRWQHRLGNQMFRPISADVTIAVVNGAVLASAGDAVGCFDARTGDTRWRRTDPFSLAPQCHDDQMLFVYRSAPAHIDAVDVTDGSRSRLFDRPKLGRPILATRELLVTLELEQCVGIERATGAERWSVNLTRPSTLPARGGGTPTGQPARVGELVVVPIAGYGLVALRHETGEIAWEVGGMDGGEQNMAIHDGVAHIFTARHYTAVDVASGSCAASRDISTQCRAIGVSHVGLPAFHAAALVAVDASGVALAYDHVNDKIMWHTSLGARVPYACWPVVADDTLWVMDVTGHLHVFELSP